MAFEAKYRERASKRWKKGNPSERRHEPKYQIDDNTRVDFLVLKVNGGAPLLTEDLTQLDPAELVTLGRHLEWLLSMTSPGVAFDNAKASLDRVNERLPDAPRSSSSSFARPLAGVFLDRALSQMMTEQGIEATLGFAGVHPGSGHDHSAPERQPESDRVWTEADLRPQRHVPSSSSPSAAGSSASADRTPPPIVGKRRKLSEWERAVAAKYFPVWFDLDQIDLLASFAIGRAWWKARVAIPYDMFDNENYQSGSVENSRDELEYLFHELFHVFQRSLGRPIEAEHFRYRRAVKRKRYHYDTGIARNEVLDHFLRVNFESQAEMFGDAAADKETGASTGHFQRVLDYVRTLPPDSTVSALMHPDLPADPRDQTPDPRTP